MEILFLQFFSVWEVSSTSGKNAFLLFWKRKTQLLPNCLLMSPFRGPWVKGILGNVSDHFHSCITASANMLHIVQRHWTTERLVMCPAKGTFPSGFESLTILPPSGSHDMMCPKQRGHLMPTGLKITHIPPWHSLKPISFSVQPTSRWVWWWFCNVTEMAVRNVTTT